RTFWNLCLDYPTIPPHSKETRHEPPRSHSFSAPRGGPDLPRGGSSGGSMITPQEALQRTIEHREIFHDEMLKVVRMIMSGELSSVMMAAPTTGLRVKKETIGEITAA